MGLAGRLIDAIARAEDALDRLKLRYKERFDRFAPAHVQAYRGFGTEAELRLLGRVMEADEIGFDPHPRLWRRIRHAIHRLETDEIRGARVRATLAGHSVTATADDEAFLDFTFRPPDPVAPGWHEVRLEVVESMASQDTGPVTAEVLVPSPDADFLVVSDLDDTVLRSGAQHKLRLARAFLLEDAMTRIPFEGVAAFYRALAAGPSGDASNPFFYLSRSPWNFYELFTRFMDEHSLPKGPLMLRDVGIRGILGDDDESYKADVVRDLLARYPRLPLVLIGDSGQRDPEVYRQLALQDPDRVKAIVIRDVTTPERDAEVRHIARELEAVGVPMVLAEHSRQAAERAVELGLMRADGSG